MPVNRAIKIWQKIETEMKVTIMSRTTAGQPQNNVFNKSNQHNVKVKKCQPYKRK